MTAHYEQADKPQAQIAGVQGFNAFGAKEKPVDWGVVASLPAFQVFLAEQASGTPKTDSDHWIKAETHKGVQAEGSTAFYSRYCQWHEQKGMWPNETPMGKLIEEE